jgi:hypothetical protein
MSTADKKNHTLYQGWFRCYNKIVEPVQNNSIERAYTSQRITTATSFPNDNVQNGFRNPT